MTGGAVKVVGTVVRASLYPVKLQSGLEALFVFLLNGVLSIDWIRPRHELVRYSSSVYQHAQCLGSVLSTILDGSNVIIDTVNCGGISVRPTALYYLLSHSLRSNSSLTAAPPVPSHSSSVPWSPNKLGRRIPVYCRYLRWS